MLRPENLGNLKEPLQDGEPAGISRLPAYLNLVRITRRRPVMRIPSANLPNPDTFRKALAKFFCNGTLGARLVRG